VRVVLDTNVLVSAAMTLRGICAQIVDLLADGAFDIYVDDRILDEYDDVLRRPELCIVPAEATLVLDLVRAVAQNVPAYPLLVTLPDPDDVPFLEVAASAGALLITGNARHFAGADAVGVTVATPREFLDLLRGATGE